MAWLILFIAQSVLAAAVAQPSDIVLIYESADIEEQGKENYLFTAEGDETLYPCEANRCSLVEFADQNQVNLTIYKLPEGYPRVATIIDQSTLQEYAAAAAITYTVSNVATTLSADGSDTRSYQTVQLKADGSYELGTVSQERNVLLQEDTVTEQSRKSNIMWYIIIGLVVVGMGGGAVWLWKRKF